MGPVTDTSSSRSLADLDGGERASSAGRQAASPRTARVEANVWRSRMSTALMMIERPRSTTMWPTLPWIVAAALGCYTTGEVMRCRQRAPSVSGRCRVRRPKWTSSSVTGIRGRW